MNMTEKLLGNDYINLMYRNYSEYPMIIGVLEDIEEYDWTSIVDIQYLLVEEYEHGHNVNGDLQNYDSFVEYYKNEIELYIEEGHSIALLTGYIKNDQYQMAADNLMEVVIDKLLNILNTNYEELLNGEEYITLYKVTEEIKDLKGHKVRTVESYVTTNDHPVIVPGHAEHGSGEYEDVIIRKL